MTSSAQLPGRDRLAILAALVGVSAIAWLWLMDMAGSMGGGMAAMGAPAIVPWSAADAAMTFAMWAIMMVGMMVPSAVPMVMMFAAMTRRAEARGRAMAPVWIFAAGYVVAWIAFGGGATVLQWWLEQAALLTPAMTTASPLLGAALLVAAGLYQWTPLKHACLRNCRTPAEFLARHWRAGAVGALQTGLRHGLYCIGCCWALMAILFVGGVMNLVWVAAIAIFVLAEKLLPLPAGRILSNVTGGLLAGFGGVLFYNAL